MNSFIYETPTKVYFGQDEEQKIGKILAEYHPSKVLVHFGSGSARRSGLLDRVEACLTEEGIRFTELGGVVANPALSLVREGIALAQKEGVDFVLAVGGGSVLDSAKAIANAACYDGDPWDLFDGTCKNDRVLPLGVIVTIPAAGSEMSDSSVITRESDLCKRGRNTPLNYPKFSILNPEYTYSLPSFQTACGAVDIMAHMMERYFTNTQHVELIDRMTEGALKTVIHNAPIALTQPENYDARAEIMWAAALAHNGLLGTGRVTDWASHRLEHELSALYDIAHGAGLAIVFPAWMKYVLSKGCVSKLRQFAIRVFDVSEDFGSDEAIASEGIARLERFYRSLGLPTTLHESGIGEENFDRMAHRAVTMGGGHLGNYYPIHEEDALAIYRLAR